MVRAGLNFLFESFQRFKNTAFGLGVPHEKNNVEKKTARLPFLFLSDAVDGISSFLCGKWLMEPSSLSIVLPSLTKD